MALARFPEPELMLDAAQAQAYAAADFSKPHAHVIRRFQQLFPSLPEEATVADLGCGPADIAIRLARLYPGFHIDAIDGSRAMLDCAAITIKDAGLTGRIRLVEAVLPDPTLPHRHYDVVVSNSLLHHLHAPATLWQTIRQIAKPGARVFVTDLLRPDNKQAARQTVKTYAANEPEILQRDFYNSLLAAFTPEELHTQLAPFNFEFKVETLDDHHLTVSLTV